QAGVEAIVLELADGVLQPETASLLASAVFREAVGGILFAACDSMGAAAGHASLRGRNLPVVGLSGVLTSSPLQCKESSIALGLPIFPRSELGQARTAMQILARASRA